MRKKVMVKKSNLNEYLAKVTNAMAEINAFFNVEIKECKKRDDCVWVIIG